MIHDGPVEHQFVSPGFRQQGLETVANPLRIPHQGAGQGLLHRHQFPGGPLLPQRLHRQRQLAGIPSVEAQELLLYRGELEAGLPFAVGGDQVDADHGIGLGPANRGAILGAVKLQRLEQQTGGKMGGKAERQPHGCRQLGAVETGAQQPDGHMESLTRHRLHGTNLVAKITHQLANVRREIVHLATALPAQRLHGALIAPGSAAEAEIDAIRVKGA